jgi:hypothetical protein
METEDVMYITLTQPTPQNVLNARIRKWMQTVYVPGLKEKEDRINAQIQCTTTAPLDAEWMCVICQSGEQVDGRVEEFTTLVCWHTFHADCVRNLKRLACPLCAGEVASHRPLPDNQNT